jgi:hypothetical protein
MGMEIHGDENSLGRKLTGTEMDGVEIDGVEMDGRRKKTKLARISGWGGESAVAKEMHFRRCVECPWTVSGICL